MSSKYYIKHRIRITNTFDNPYGLTHKNPKDSIFKVIDERIFSYNFYNKKFVRFKCDGDFSGWFNKTEEITELEFNELLQKETIVRELTR